MSLVSLSSYHIPEVDKNNVALSSRILQRGSLVSFISQSFVFEQLQKDITSYLFIVFLVILLYFATIYAFFTNPLMNVLFKHLNA